MMNSNLIETCELFIQNREVLHDYFKWEGDEMIRLASLILTGRGEAADGDKLKECESILKSESGWLSIFRGQIKMPMLCNMVNKADPAEFFRNVDRTYKLMGMGRGADSALKALIAISLADKADEEMDIKTLADRTSEIYEKLRLEKKIHTDGSTFMTAATLAISGIESNEDIDSYMQDVVACRELLEDSVPRNTLDSVCMMLGTSDTDAEDKCSRLKDLLDKLEYMDINCKKGSAAQTAASLVMLDQTTEEIASEVAEAAAYLKEQRGFGTFGCSANTRNMYAAILVMCAYMPGSPAEDAAAANVVREAVRNLLIAMNTMMMTTNINLMMQNNIINNING